MLQFPLRAAMEDGTTFEVVGDQRDAAAFEVQPFGCAYPEYPSKVFTATRFIAWHAGKRAGATKLSWDKFNEQCVEVVDLLKEPDPEASDPGQSAASADT